MCCTLLRTRERRCSRPEREGIACPASAMQPLGGGGGGGGGSGSVGLPPANPPHSSNHHPSSSASSSTASSSSCLAEDLLKLSTHLKQETLYVQNTKRQLVQLHEDITRQAQGLAQQVWICAHQRQNNEIIHSTSSALSCMQRYTSF